MALIEAEAAKVGSKALIWAIGVAVTLGIGATGAEIYEHRAPWGLEAQRDRIRDSIPGVQTAAYRAASDAQVAADRGYFDMWATRVVQAEAKATRISTDDAQTLASLRTAMRTSQSAAYNLGRASCGDKPDASLLPPGSPAPVSLPDGDTDLGSLLAAGAYAPAP